MEPKQMIRRIKSLTRSAFNLAGLEVHRHQKRPHPLQFLRETQLHTVLDIGANKGQFALEAIKLFPEARVYSFEPLAHVYQELECRSRSFPQWSTHQVALGASDGSAQMYSNAFSPASSLLPLTSVAKDAFPHTREASSATVSVRTLDSWTATVKPDAPILIKLDVQGYEDRVVAGGPETFKRATALFMEVSFQPIYDGQLLFDDIHELVRGLGFRCAGIEGETHDPTTGRLLYGDALYIR